MRLILVLTLATHSSCLALGSARTHLHSCRTPPPYASVDSGEKLVPLADYLVVDLQSVPSATQAGVLLPTVFQDDQEDDAFVKPEPRAGTVLAVGPGIRTRDGEYASMPAISTGQKVVVAPTAGVRVPLEGRPLRESTIFLFKADEIWAMC